MGYDTIIDYYEKHILEVSLKLLRKINKRTMGHPCTWVMVRYGELPKINIHLQKC